MPGAVPLEDLPDTLRGTAVPADDLPGAPDAGYDPSIQPDFSLTKKPSRTQRVFKALMGVPGVGMAQAAAEGVWNSAAKIPTGWVGLLDAAIPGDDPTDTMEMTRNLLSVNPTADVVRDPLVQGVGNIAKAGSKLLSPVTRPADRWLEQNPTAQSIVQGGTEAMGDLANVLGTGAGIAATRAPINAAREGLRQSALVREAGSVAPVAKAAGFEVTPSAVGGARSTQPKGTFAALEGQARNPEASLRNAQTLNTRLADELGIKAGADGRLDPVAFDEARLPAFGVYEQGRAWPGGPSPEYSADVAQAIQSIDVPTEAAQEVARLMQKYGDVADSARLVEDLKNLRRTAAKRREGDTANQVANEALADVQMAIADSLENELGRRAAAAGDAGFQQRLRDARQHLAQLYETERATSGGYVDAAQLAARQQKTGRLTGNLQLGAQMGENLPDVFQHPQSAVGAAMGRTPEAWGARSFLFRVGERLGGSAVSRRGMRKFNERIPVGPNALDEFGISPVRDRPNPPFMGPNDGPAAPPPPPSAPSGMFADDIPAPRTPMMPGAGRPEPSGPMFNTLLADEMAGDLQLEGAMPPVPAARAPQRRPLDAVDFERAAPPGAPGQTLPPLTQEQLRLAEQPLDQGNMFELQGEPSFADLLQPPLRQPRFGPADEFRGQDPLEMTQEITLPAPDGMEFFDGGDTMVLDLPTVGGFADELSLVPDTGRPPYVDVGAAPAQSNAVRVGPKDSPAGTLTYNRRDGQRFIESANVDEGQRGKGLGQEMLLKAAREAQDAGEVLNSDYSVTAAQLRAYEAAQKKGLITFEYTDPEIVKAALQSDGVAKLKGQPVVRNIRPVEGMYDLLGD